MAKLWTDKRKQFGANAAKEKTGKCVAKYSAQVIAQNKGKQFLLTALYILRQAETQGANNPTAHAEAVHYTE